MISIVSLSQAKDHLYVDDDDHDADIEAKILQASDMVLARLKYAAIPDEWIVNSSPITYDIPYRVHAYTLLICGELYANRESSVFNIEAILKLLDNDRMPTQA